MILSRWHSGEHGPSALGVAVVALLDILIDDTIAAKRRHAGGALVRAGGALVRAGGRAGAGRAVTPVGPAAPGARARARAGRGLGRVAPRVRVDRGAGLKAGARLARVCFLARHQWGWQRASHEPRDGNEDLQGRTEAPHQTKPTIRRAISRVNVRLRTVMPYAGSRGSCGPNGLTPFAGDAA